MSSFQQESDDGDTDSLSSALSDYNALFYDAPTIDTNKEKKKLLDVFMENSSEAFFSDGKTDDFLDSLSTSIDQEEGQEEEEVTHVKLQTAAATTAASESDVDVDNEPDVDVEKELEDYLNDDDPCLDCYKFSSAESDLKAKIESLDSLEFKFENYESFRLLAVEKYGLLNKKFRRKVWPLLILFRNKFYNIGNNSGHDDEPTIDSFIHDSMNKFNHITEEEIKKNVYYNQVTLDVVRTLKRFPPEISEKLRLKLQHQLINLICKILVKYSNLHYYQGYHDICLTFLLVNGVDQCIPLLEHLTLSHFTRFMETTMESTLDLLFNIMPLIDSISSPVAEHIQRAELGVIFGLSWLITWYSHVMDNLTIILRLYDFFIATHPLMPIYLGAVIVTEKSEQILSTDCDMASLHTIITKFPSKIDDIEQLEECITKTLNLFEKYPPDYLPVLNEKWLEKCKRIQREAMNDQDDDEAYLLRQRRKKKDPFADSDNNNNKLAKLNHHHVHSKNYVKNRLLVGLTVTMGVAAVAMYALNSNVVKDPQDLISKFYSFLSYKEF